MHACASASVGEERERKTQRLSVSSLCASYRAAPPGLQATAYLRAWLISGPPTASLRSPSMRLAPSAARPVLCSVRSAPVRRPPARCISSAERPSAPQGPFRLPSQRGAKPSPTRSKLLRVALPDAPSYRRPHDPTVRPALPTTPLDPALIPAGPARTEIERLLSTQRVDAALEVFRTLPKSAALYGHFINHLLDRNHFHASAAFEVRVLLRTYLPHRGRATALRRDGCAELHADCANVRRTHTRLPCDQPASRH